MRIIKLGIKRRRKMLTARLNGNVLRVDLKRLKRFVSALLPPGSAQTQHTSPNAAAAAAAAAAVKTIRLGVVSGNDIPMITELGLYTKRRPAFRCFPVLCIF